MEERTALTHVTVGSNPPPPGCYGVQIYWDAAVRGFVAFSAAHMMTGWGATRAEALTALEHMVALKEAGVIDAGVAQEAERTTCNCSDRGSNPLPGSACRRGDGRSCSC